MISHVVIRHYDDSPAVQRSTSKELTSINVQLGITARVSIARSYQFRRFVKPSLVPRKGSGRLGLLKIRVHSLKVTLAFPMHKARVKAHMSFPGASDRSHSDAPRN